MKTESSIKEGEIACIRGRTFQGEVRHNGSSLVISITDFVKRLNYEVEFNEDTLRKEFKFLIFKQIDDLFIELVTNKKLEISDEQSLLIPLEIDYNGRAFPLRAEIPLALGKIENPEKTADTLYKLIARMNDFYGGIVEHQKIVDYRKKWVKKTQDLKGVKEGSGSMLEGSNSFQQIIFNGDTDNKNYGCFKVADNIVELQTGNQLVVYNHNETLPKNGLFYFKFKPTRVSGKNFYAGLCGKNIIGEVNDGVLKSPYFMAFKFQGKGSYITNNNVVEGVGDINLTDKSVIKLEINMNIKNVTWFHNNEPFYIAKIPKDLMDVYIHPFVGLFKTSDKVEFINN